MELYCKRLDDIGELYRNTIGCIVAEKGLAAGDFISQYTLVYCGIAV